MPLTRVDPPPDVSAGGDRVEVRVLGPLRVRRADGTAVDHRDWRTKKTVDLLRLLALQVGHPVSVAHIVDRLWPDVPEDRGRASLRTAASTIRQVLGPTSLERRQGGLELRDAWVDAVAFRTLAREAGSYQREGMPARVVTTAHEAEALYLDDLGAADETTSWVADERAALRETYRTLLEDAADAALSLGWDRDAASFATRASALDPCAERPVRTLMTACAHLGQQQQSLRAFQRLRRAMAEELGVDPSPETGDLHVRVLNNEVAVAAAPRAALVGRQVQLRQLVAVLTEAGGHALPTVVELRGRDGCGRRRLLDEACARTGATWEAVEAVPGGPRAGTLLYVRSAVLAGLAADLSGSPGAATLVAGDVGDDVREELVGRGWTWHRVVLPPLSRDEVADLVREVLGGPVDTTVLEHVTARGGGIPASVTAAARTLVRSRRVRSTPDGLTLVPAEAGPDVDAQALLAHALELLPAGSHDVMHTLALLGSPVTLDALLPALDGGPTSASVRRALDHLVDLELLSDDASGYRFRHPLVASSVRAWSRPSARRARHARIAERALLPAADRVHHWLEAGEPHLACAAAVDAARAALVADRQAEARELLLEARELSTMLGCDPADQVELGEELGDVCVRLGRLDEAADVYSSTLRGAVSITASHRERLERRRAAAAAGRVPVEAVTPRAGTSARSWTLSQLADELGLPPDAGPSPQTEELLRGVLDEVSSSRAPDASDRAAATRVLLADRVLLPRRQLTRAREVLAPVPSLTNRPDLLGRAALSRWLPDVLLGDARAARAPLAAALASVDRAGPAPELAMLLQLARHDTGAAPGSVLAGGQPPAGPWWDWVVLRVLTEAGMLDEADAWRPGAGGRSFPLLRQLAALSTAGLHEAAGRRDAATALLRAAADEAVTTRTILLLPEIAARLVILESGLDDQMTQDDFDLMDWALGGEPAHPRETFFRLLARAHVRAQKGEPERAAVAATSARAVAVEHGLVVLEGRAARVEQALHEMEQRRRSSDRTGEPGASVPPGRTERRTQFPHLGRVHHQGGGATVPAARGPVVQLSP